MEICYNSEMLQFFSSRLKKYTPPKKKYTYHSEYFIRIHSLYTYEIDR